ncbi:hypothetical protein [Photorhabdus hainanensis]|uniref:hypothetical protein n=1 Tax=Photorhabdus hainanensis TaxID=1004166 RepID=UPI003CCE6B0D
MSRDSLNSVLLNYRKQPQGWTSGFFVPRSQSDIRFLLTFKYRAKTGCDKCSRSRRERISSGESDSMGVKQAASNSRMVCLLQPLFRLVPPSFRELQQTHHYDIF